MVRSPQTLAQQNTPTGVLQSVAVITGQRDRDLMAVSLVNTLVELIDCNRIAMYRLYPGDPDQLAVLVSEARKHPDVSLAHAESSVVVSANPDFSTVVQTATEVVQSLDGEFLSVYPIVGQHGVAGLLEMKSNTRNDADRHLTLAFLKVYSNYLTLLDESETDTLTGLLNRRTFDNNIEKIVAERSPPDSELNASTPENLGRRTGAAEHPHWLAVLDIDHFKRVNDRFGHLYGDEVLILLARQMRLVFRQADKLFRFGGEEFVVVLDRTSLENAKQVLERFRSAIEHFHFPQLGKITVSIGFVRLDKNDVPSSIIGRADQALYYAKHHGRNQVCFYEDLLAAGKLAGEHFSDDIQLF